MVFIGGWRNRRRGRFGPGGPPGYDPQYGPPGYDPQYGPAYGGGYGRRGYRRGFGGGYGGGFGGGNTSCLRDMLLVEGGCCLAESLGCGPQLVLVAPAAGWRAMLARTPEPLGRGERKGARARLLAVLLAMISGYQTEISAHRRASCRFTPTCSHYAAQALQEHGMRRGLWLTARRLLRCRPGARGGADLVPQPWGPA